jgi:threonine dehydrogenase-like Zn-dependent dehydrogenase
LDLRSRRVVDNAWATARGFVQALAAAAEHRGRHLAAQEALVLGLGPVGMHAVRALCEEGARVCVHDLDAHRLARCAAEEHVSVARCLREALSTIDYVLDATPSAAIIDAPELRPGTIVSSPGVPHGLTPAALSRLGTAFIHDELALGVAVMAVAGSQGGDPSRKPCSRAPAAGLRTG